MGALRIIAAMMLTWASYVVTTGDYVPDPLGLTDEDSIVSVVLLGM